MDAFIPDEYPTSLQPMDMSRKIVDVLQGYSPCMLAPICEALHIDEMPFTKALTEIMTAIRVLIKVAIRSLK